jgi:sugar/nucleoside kinase (ribokinase family)
VIVTVGDLVEDVVVRLDGPINVASDTTATITRRRGGSAANVAAAAARLGRRARFVGHVGDDATGRGLVEALEADGVETVVRRVGRSATIVVLVDAQGERSMLSDRATCTDLTDPDPAWLDGAAWLHLPVYSLVAEPVGSTCVQLVRWAHERGVKLSVDASSSSVMRAYGVERLVTLLRSLAPTVLLANEDEAACFGAALDPAVLGCGSVVVKQGPDPTLVLDGTATGTSIPVAPLNDVRDTTGAGDAFAAGFLVALAEAADTETAVRAGHASAADAIRRASASHGA